MFLEKHFYFPTGIYRVDLSSLSVMRAHFSTRKWLVMCISQEDCKPEIVSIISSLPDLSSVSDDDIFFKWKSALWACVLAHEN